MNGMYGFLVSGAARLSRQIPDLVVSFFLPSVTVAVCAAARIESWVPILLLSGGTPLVLMCGYDYGRVHETGVFRRLAVCGLSGTGIFTGTALPRVLLFLVTTVLPYASGTLVYGTASVLTGLCALACSSVVFAVLGLLFYRLSGSALGVLSWGSVGTMLCALPLLGPSRGLPPWIPLLSPVSAVLAYAGEPGGTALAGTFAWVVAAAVAVRFLSGSGERV